MTMTNVRCSVDGCERPARLGNTICKTHQARQWRERQGTCSIEGCERRINAGGLCVTHYQRRRTGKDWQSPIPERMKTDGSCSVEGCARPKHSRGYCTMHYQRMYMKGEVGPVERRKAESGEGNIQRGYRYLTINGGKVAEHRHVMEQILGRPLYSFETPHHKNGRRADNRPANLELWTKPQLAGQRVEDLIDFVVKHYPSEVREALGG